MRCISRNINLLRLLRKDLPNFKFCPDPHCSSEFHATSLSSWMRRMAHNQVPFTEKMRKKIWGTDNPPGQADPYNEQRFDMNQARGELVGEDRRSEWEKRKPAISSAFDDYEPATVWDGLEHVGDSEEGICNDDWLPGRAFQASFIPGKAIVGNHQVAAASERKKIGSKIVSLKFPDNATRDKIVHSLSSANEGIEKDIKKYLAINENPRKVNTSGSSPNCVDATGTNFPGELDDDKNVKDLSPLEPSTSNKGICINLAESQDIKNKHPAIEDIVASWDASWKDVPLTDSNIKFAVTKRMLQLSGVRLSDAAITSIQTANCLLAHLVKPPKPQKLAEALHQNKDLTALPNVKIHERRITTRDKEMAVGRWKLIEAEFRARGLAPKINTTIHS